MLRGIEDKLWEHGLHTILCTTLFDIEKVTAYFQSLLQKDIAGVIFAPVRGADCRENNKRILDMLATRRIPYVLLDRYIPGLLVNSVASNNHQGSKELTQRLIKKGHTRILVLAGVECSSINERLQGHVEALNEAGLEQDPNLIIRIDDICIETQEQHEEELERVRGLIKKAGDFTACYTLNSTALQIATQFLLSRNRETRRDIEFVTYDDITDNLRGITDHVTFVKQPGYRMGWEAAKLLIDSINEPDQRIAQITLTAEIIEKVIE
jgi:DNA-binding LacI/PurR family transcriptional regulator